MTPIAVICVVLTALCIGYLFGRRAGSTPSPWKKRVSRTALGRAATSLIVLLIARRMQRNILASRALSKAVGVWMPKSVELLHLLRNSLSLQRFP